MNSLHKLGKEGLLKSKASINGAWIESNKTFDVINPADGSVIQHVADLDISHVKSAIAGAYKAWKSFKSIDAYSRSSLLKRWHGLILLHRDALAELITLESGKPLSESEGEVDYGASFVEWFAEEAKRSYGDVIPSSREQNKIITIKQSVGVVAAITSWNFPLAMITRKVAPAIAAGCSIILRPASKTPLTALALAKLAEEAGWPSGVLNVITGTDSAGIGKELSTNPAIRKLSFTGSTAIGKLLMSQASSSVKKVSLELGGNAPFIVFDDANLDDAVEGALFAKFRNTGQTCVAVNRFYVQNAVFDEFVQRMAEKVKALRVGNGLEEGIQIGPMVDQKGLNKVSEHVHDALDKGARLLSGGKVIRGLFYEPTVLADVADETLIAREETFGPVVSIFRFYTEEEVIAKANQTEYGLAAYFYSQNVSRCWRVAEALETGMVGINEGRISFAGAPFGGIKESGVGREGSKYGLDEFMEVKYLNFRMTP